MKTTIAELKDFEGKEVVLNGWVYNLRSIGKIWFLILRDGTGLVQCVVVKADTEESIFNLENKESVNTYCVKHSEVENIKKVKWNRPGGLQETNYKVTKPTE